MNRREFCKSTLATAAAVSLPSQHLLASTYPFLSGAASSVSAMTASGAETILGQSVVKDLTSVLNVCSGLFVVLYHN